LSLYAIQPGKVRLKHRFGDSHVWIETAMRDAFNSVYVLEKTGGWEEDEDRGCRRKFLSGPGAHGVRFLNWLASELRSLRREFTPRFTRSHFTPKILSQPGYTG
jgi:hypothetical protein